MWKSTKEGPLVTFKKNDKDNLTVVWDAVEKKYEVRRNDEVVEKGHAQDLPVESFLQYVDMTWGDK